MLTAPRCSHTGMCVLNLQHPLQNPKQLVNDSLANRQHKVVNIQEFIDADRVKFLHASIGRLPLSTVKQEINTGCLQSWPDLTVKLLNKLPEPEYTMLSHMDHIRKNKLSTKIKEVSEWDLTLETYIPNK